MTGLAAVGSAADPVTPGDSILGGSTTDYYGVEEFWVSYSAGRFLLRWKTLTEIPALGTAGLPSVDIPDSPMWVASGLQGSNTAGNRGNGWRFQRQANRGVFVIVGQGAYTYGPYEITVPHSGGSPAQLQRFVSPIPSGDELGIPLPPISRRWWRLGRLRA